MPRKRKEVVSDSAPAAKRSRAGSDLESGGHTLHWQWENDGQVWTSYSSEHAFVITDAYNAGKKDVTFDVAPKVQVKVIFEKMVQKNKKTGWERRVRCALKNSTNTDWHVWQWEDERGQWNPYNMKTSVEVENATVGGEDEVSIGAGRREYTINISDMEQTNTSTNVSRKIDKLKIDVSKEALQTCTEAPEATPSTSSSVSDTPSNSTKSAAKGSSGRGKSKGNKATSPDDEAGGDYKKSSVRTVVVKGAAPVDPECTAKVNTAHVYSRGKDVYDVMLNQTNLSNNNNKYYLMQVLEDDSRKAYSVWFRWGRVGYNGQTTLTPCGPNLEEALNVFCKKFQDKTKNDWALRSKFSKVSGKYDLVKMDYNAENMTKKKKVPTATLC